MTSVTTKNNISIESKSKSKSTATPMPPLQQSQSSDNVLLKSEQIKIQIPGSTVTAIAPPKIVPMNLPFEKVERLKKYLAANNRYPLAQKNMQQRVSGFCLLCSGVPDFFMIYDVDGAPKVERYCSSCLKKEKESEMERKNNDNVT